MDCRHYDRLSDDPWNQCSCHNSSCPLSWNDLGLNWLCIHTTYHTDTELSYLWWRRKRAEPVVSRLLYSRWLHIQHDTDSRWVLPGRSRKHILVRREHNLHHRFRCSNARLQLLLTRQYFDRCSSICYGLGKHVQLLIRRGFHYHLRERRSHSRKPQYSCEWPNYCAELRIL